METKIREGARVALRLPWMRNWNAHFAQCPRYDTYREDDRGTVAWIRQDWPGSHVRLGITWTRGERAWFATLPVSAVKVAR